MVGGYQNLNGSRDLTTPIPGLVCHTWASNCYNQPTKFEVFIPTHDVYMTGDTKCRKWGLDFEVVSGHSRSLEIAPIVRTDGHSTTAYTELV